MDRVLDQVEGIVKEQYEKGKTAAEARRAVREALEENDSASGGPGRRTDQ
jgi:hypothetical protein